MSFVLAGVIRLLVGDPVDGHESAVQDRERQPGGSSDGGVEGVGQGGEEVDGLAHVAPGGGGADGEPGGKPRVGVAVSQVRQSEAGLLTRGPTAPPASTFGAAGPDQ